MPNEDEFLTVSEVAEILKVNDQTVRNWIDRGELTAVRVGARRVRIRQSDLDAFIASTNPGLPPSPPPGHDAAERVAWEQIEQQRADIAHALRRFVAASNDLLQVLEAGESPRPE